jgi:hypothetical protein
LLPETKAMLQARAKALLPETKAMLQARAEAMLSNTLCTVSSSLF